MSYYMVRCDYTASAWRDLLSEKQVSAESRLAPVRQLARKFGGDFVELVDEDGKGGRVLGKFISFGAHDLIGIVRMPTPTAARSFAMVISSHEGVRGFEITPLLTFDEGVEAMQQGYEHKAEYRVPGDSKA